MSVPDKLHWHSYGAVDVALHAVDSRPDDDYCGNGPPEPSYEIYAKYTRPISQPGRPIEYDHRIFRHEYDMYDRDTDGNPKGYWSNVNDGGCTEAENAPTHLFDAAATLLSHDFDCFQACDSAMGDPYP